MRVPSGRVSTIFLNSSMVISPGLSFFAYSIFAGAASGPVFSSPFQEPMPSRRTVVFT